jgi:hypothetical protein
VSADLLEFYSAAYGISKQWLQSGRLPSGLGPAIDANIGAAVRAPEKYIASAEKSPKLASSNSMPVGLKSGRPPRTVRVPEYLWSDLERHSADRARTRPRGVLQLPGLELDNSVTSSHQDIFSVLADKLEGPYRRNSRVFVVASLEYRPGAEYLLLGENDLRIVRLDEEGYRHLSRGALVGRVIGKLESVHS